MDFQTPKTRTEFLALHENVTALRARAAALRAEADALPEESDAREHVAGRMREADMAARDAWAALYQAEIDEPGAFAMKLAAYDDVAAWFATVQPPRRFPMSAEGMAETLLRDARAIIARSAPGELVKTIAPPAGVFA